MSEKKAQQLRGKLPPNAALGRKAGPHKLKTRPNRKVLKEELTQYNPEEDS